MLQGIASLIDAITKFIANFSKLNTITIRSIRIFGVIMLIGVIIFFLVMLCTKEELYNQVLNQNPIIFIFIMGIMIFAYSGYSQKKIMNNLINVLKTEKQKEKEHNALIYSQTTKIENSARSLTKSLLSSLNADISTVEMLHNRDTFDSGVHCRYYDECYCSTRDGVYFPAQKYQKMPTSVLPIIAYMEEQEYLYISIEELKKIDMGYSIAVSSLENHHIALRFMRNKDGKPLGILTCAWRTGLGDTMPDENTIKDKMYSTAAKLELLLDIN